MPDYGRWNANGGDPSLNEINRTDQFLDALASQQQPYVTDRAEAELAQLLAGWRDDVRETPMGHVLTPLQAEAALNKVTRPAPKRRLSLAVVGSAAAAMLAIGGFGAVVAGSGPGDALYGLRTMLFGEQQTKTRDDAVILAAQTEMQQVQQLIDQGDWAGAQQRLEAVTTTVATVNDFEQKQELITQWQELTVKVEAQDPVATLPPDAPLPTFPDIPTELLDPATVPLAPWETSTGTSSETTPPSSSETTPPSSATPSSETSAPSGTPSTTPSTSVGATQSSTTAPTSTTATRSSAAPTSTTTPSATPSSTASSTSPSSVPSSTTTGSPSPTSTTVVVQSTTTTRAPLPTPSAAAPSPTPTAAPIPTPTAAPIPTPQAPIPTPSAAPIPTPEAPLPTPTAALIPTTTTPVSEG